jgi:hypothetical protein
MPHSAARLTAFAIFHRALAALLVWLLAIGPLPFSAFPDSPRSSSDLSVLADAFPMDSQGVAAPVDQPPDSDAQASQKEKADQWGEITVAQPKIWQYERVNSLLDGLLRDVEGVSMSDLIALNPNASNSAAVKFVQSMLEIGVKYDQGAAVSNTLAQQNYQIQQNFAATQLQANNTYLQQLYQQRDLVNSQLFAAMQQNSTLLNQLATTDPNSAGYPAIQTAQTAAAGNVTTIQAQLTAINGQITTASAAPVTASPPALTSTSAGPAPETANTFGSFLGSLPSGLMQSINSQLQSPTYPATTQLDNFIALLYERLAREISVLQDDLVRDPSNMAFLVQFDVALYPSSRAKNHVGVAEFTMDCDDCKVYSVYPGQSSYNLTNYEGASKRYSFWGNLLTLIGLGISADYRRQTDTLHSNLVQSVYMSGFQEGREVADRSGQPQKQRFGWYYGAAPFEPLVTPGIRSTFAIVTVPRRLVIGCKDNSKCLPGISLDGQGNPALSFRSRTEWVRRDDPLFQKPHYLWPSTYVGSGSSSSIPLNDPRHPDANLLRVPLPGASNAEFYEAVASEGNQLHALAMEYNTVFYPKPDTPAKKTPDAPAPPGTSTATATGTGTGSSSVTVSGAGTATANSSGTTASTVTATATNPGTASTSSSDATKTDPLTNCPKLQCAAVLLTLDQPIDPNLIVTVRGQPLKRVRDWRGRATSILPPAQSASDMPASSTSASASASTSATTPAGPKQSQNAGASALLEADLLAANTWFEVDSHRLLLNISQDLATNYEFPIIQITDPAKRTLVIPNQLDEGYTDLITNGFHMAPRSDTDLQRFVTSHFLHQKPACDDVCTDPKTLLPGGPYAAGTFLPLFLQEPAPEKFYAFLGETGNQVLVGFLPESLSSTGEKAKKYHNWLPSLTQVILEDRDLDLAWSLSCAPQGTELVCDIPQKEIAATFQTIKTVCNKGNENRCMSLNNHWKDFPFISTLQLWVEQDDPDNKDSFYSPAPATLGLTPVQTPAEDVPNNENGAANSSNSTAEQDNKLTGPDTGFRPWYYFASNPGTVTLEGCYGKRLTTTNKLQILGQHIPDNTDINSSFAAKVVDGKSCATIAIPTVALTHEEVVIKSDNQKLTVPFSLVTALFRPYFEKPIIVPVRSEESPFQIISWNVELPAGRVNKDDQFDTDLAHLCPAWEIGGAFIVNVTVAKSDPACKPPAKFIGGTDWDTESRAGQVHLVLTISKNDLKYLPKKPIHLIRNHMVIATLPDIRSLLLPSKLTLASISGTQFSLEGTGAGTIDAVSLQGSSGVIGPIPVATGADLALVSLPKAPDKAKNTPASAPAIGPAITDISPASGKEGDTITITGTDFGTKPLTISFGNLTAKTSATPSSSTKITAKVPSGASTGYIFLTTAAKVESNRIRFTVTGNSTTLPPTDGPSITKATVSGSDLTITGDNFNSDPTKDKVKIGKSDLVPTNVSAKSLTVTLPSGTTTGKVVVTVSGIPSNTSVFGTTSPAPKSAETAASDSNTAAPGTYTVLALVAAPPSGTDKGGYLPIEITDENGKPLLFTVPAAKNNTNTQTKDSGGQTTDIHVTKTVKTTGTPQTPAPPAAAPAKKPGGQM